MPEPVGRRAADYDRDRSGSQGPQSPAMRNILTSDSLPSRSPHREIACRQFRFDWTLPQIGVRNLEPAASRHGPLARLTERACASTAT